MSESKGWRVLLSVAVAGGLLLGGGGEAWAQTAGERCYVVLGDSISSGYGLEEGEQSFPQQVAQTNGLTLINLAQNGETSASLLDRLRTPQVAAAVAQADVITVTVGGNDLVNGLYAYLTQAYNQRHQDSPQTQGELQAAAMGGDWGVLTFALGVVWEFPQSQQANQALADYAQHLTQVVGEIRRENPKAQLVVVEQYDPYAALVGQLSQNPLFASTAQRLHGVVQAGVERLNQAIGDGQTLGYSVARVYEVFASAGENPCNATLSGPRQMELDYHPNAYGHTLIAQQVTQLLDSRENVTQEGAEGERETVAGDQEVMPGQTVAAPQSEEPPRTGDTEGLARGIQLAWVSGGCLGVLAVVRRRCQRHRRRL